MKLEKLDIQPLKGLSQLSFGSTMGEVMDLLGEPNEEEVMDEDEEDPTTYLWNFEDHAISVFFEEGEDDNYCTAFETYNEDAVLFGKKVFDMNKTQIIDLMKKNGFDDIEEDEEEWGEERLSFNDALVDFYFEDNVLVSLSWGADFDDNGDLILPS